MGKLKKEVVDEIRRLGMEGYTTAEIADSVSVHRDTVRKYRDGAGSSAVLKDHGELALSDGFMRRLFDLQGLLGSSSIGDALETAYRDEVTAMKFKTTSWEEYTLGEEGFTFEAMIMKLLGYIAELESDQRIHEEGYVEDHATIADLKEVAQAKYAEGHEAGYSEAMQKYAIRYRCAYCGDTCLMMPNGNDYKYVVEVLAEAGWGHSSCVRQVEYERGAGSRALRAELMR